MLKKFWMGIVTILCAIAITITINYAWFVSGYDVDPLATGSSVDAYYLKGSGTELDPYIITTPRHLYNLAWLQYLGTYNKPTTQDGTTYTSTYFKLGTTADGTLDMTGWPLPPIGTAKYPFIGNFNGNGWTISNLTTTNNFSEFGDKHPSGITANGANGTDAFEQANCGTIGFFGAIGAYNNSVISDTVTTNTPGVSYPTTTNTATNFYLNNTNVHTKTQSTIIGAVAGYVNATLSQIGVIQPHLNIATTSESAKLGSNFSDFAVVGYAESQYTTQKTKSSTIIYNPTYDYSHFNFKGMGSQAAWGGSMDLQKLYNRIKNSANSGQYITTSNENYINSELRYEGTGVNKTSVVTYGANSNFQYKSWGGINGAYLRDYSSKDYYTNDDAFQCLPALYKDVIIVTKTDTVLDGFTISNTQNSRYLNITSSHVTNTINFSVIINHESDTARTWLIDNNKIYTYNEDDGYAYYLVGNSDLSLSVTNDDSLASTWTWDSTTYRTTINSTNYYLKYFNNEWTLKNTYAISDGNNHYIKYDTAQSNNIGTATSLADATPFMFTNEGTYPSGKIYTNNGVYLRNNNTTLQLTTTNSNNEWNNNGNQLFRSINNALYYIQYNSGWVLTTPTQYYIQYNGNYLYLNNSGQIQTAGTTNINTATAFTIPNSLLTGTISNPSTGKISAIIGNNTYYLRYNNNALTTTSRQNDSGTTWSYDGHGFYQTNNSTKYYIQFRSNAWQINSAVQIETDYYYISYNSNYLSINANGSNYTNQTSINNATLWHFSNATSNPSGVISTEVSGTAYYLYDAGNYVGVSSNTSDAISWTNNGSNRLRASNSNYINYSGSRWYCDSDTQNLTITRYYIADYENTPMGFVTAAAINALTLSKLSSSQSINKTTSTAQNPITINEYTRDPVTVEPSVFNYIPINADDSSPYGVAANNTGYIMSGGYESSLNCDIRVSSFTKTNDIGAGITGSYNTNSKVFKSNSIYTIRNNNLGFIKDSTTTPSGTYYDESLFTKYSDSKSQLQTTLSNSGSYVYGLHFMDSSISKQHLVVAPSVKINGDTHNNYQMPEDCIDFTLKSKGYINFFSGYYFSGNGGTNNSFFSLHEIIRDSNGKITQIRHILKVYERDSDKQYIYYYKDDDANVYGYYTYNARTKQIETVSNFSETGHTLKYDSDWIENPEAHGVSYNSHKTYIFYFEIPVNQGEYALGSVSGKTGTYLIYLDIGANASIVDRTTITQQSVRTTQDFTYVNGIQLLETDSTYSSDANSAVAIIAASQTGTFDFSRSGNTITTPALNSTYFDDNLTCSNLSITVPNATITTKVLKYIDFNNGTNSLYYTTVKDVDGVATFETRLIGNDTNSIIVTNATPTEEQKTAEFGLLKPGTGENAGYGVLDTAANAISTHSSGFSTSSKILDYYCYIPTSQASNITENIEMNVEQVSDTGNVIVGTFTISNGTYTFPAPDSYTTTHCYKLVGNDINLQPNGLIVYIGPDTKANASITGPTSNVATVTISGSSYTFTFNASDINNAEKTITIYVQPQTS